MRVAAHAALARQRQRCQLAREPTILVEQFSGPATLEPAFELLQMPASLAYAAAGMGWADAFTHMCSTVSLGGFLSCDTSFGPCNSPLIEAIAMVSHRC